MVPAPANSTMMALRSKATDSLCHPSQKPNKDAVKTKVAPSFVVSTMPPLTSAGMPIINLSRKRIPTWVLGNSISKSASGTFWNSFNIVDPGRQSAAALLPFAVSLKRK